MYEACPVAALPARSAQQPCTSTYYNRHGSCADSPPGVHINPGRPPKPSLSIQRQVQAVGSAMRRPKNWQLHVDNRTTWEPEIPAKRGQPVLNAVMLFCVPSLLPFNFSTFHAAPMRTMLRILSSVEIHKHYRQRALLLCCGVARGTSPAGAIPKGATIAYLPAWIYH